MAIPRFLINLLPTVDFHIPFNVLSVFYNFSGDLRFFFPVGALMPLVLFNIFFDIARFIVALILRIKSFFPGMGN